MAWIRSNLDAYVREYIKGQLHSSYVQLKPLLYFLAGAEKANLDKIGDPKVGMLVGGRSLGSAKRAMMNGSVDCQVRFQTGQTDESSAVAKGGATPVASGYAEDNVGTARTFWTHFMTPVRVRQDSIENAGNNQLKIASVIEEAVGFAMQRHLEKQQSALWSGTLTPAQQALDKWPTYLGLQHTVSDGSTDSANFATYAGVDRTVETELQANVNTASALVSAGHMASTVFDVDIVRKLKTIDSIGGLYNKGGIGAGNLCITTAEGWNKMAEETEGKTQIFHNGIPDFEIGGFKYPLFKYDNTWFTYDPDCPTGELYLLTTDTFTFEIQKGHNFTTSPFVEAWKQEEGGPYHQWAQLDTKARLTNHEPWLNTKVTGLTLSA